MQPLTQCDSGGDQLKCFVQTVDFSDQVSVLCEKPSAVNVTDIFFLIRITSLVADNGIIGIDYAHG